ncbi:MULTISPECIES: DUF2786 domain-containing protein [Acinetobacter]|uniref:DUF2786 domain-containing protein n=1 Tax=Acinetobacter chengduensis TaxID=2420890 RepID=A0ABX9TR75_9GAMM|nr:MULTISPECIES: DUF2786 domain-containing protein [Acinetobacter]RKG41433.1 DUF2786 domain-containing protein [Acinetobacter sp. WCHAc060007]RLL16821.1 DUF2786 domain-containing protein [Acinetobacter chengduensis]
MNKKTVIEKIKKCLALSKSANQHEAAAALRQAMAFMEKYNIDADDPELLGIAEASILGSGSQKPTVFEAVLANSIAKMMGCKVILSGDIKLTTNLSFKKVAAWKFIGFDPAPEIASYAFDVLFRQLKKARSVFISENLKRVQIKANKVKRADLFCEGWVLEATKLVSDLNPNKEKMEQIQAYVQQKHNVRNSEPTDRNKKTNTNTDRAQNDLHAGRQAGKSAKLNNAMNGGAPLEKLGVSS